MIIPPHLLVKYDSLSFYGVVVGDLLERDDVD